MVRYHGKRLPLRIVEPVVWKEGMRWKRLDELRLWIPGSTRGLLFELSEGNAKLEVAGAGADLVKVFPAGRSLPIVLSVSSPETALSEKVDYRIAATG